MNNVFENENWTMIMWMRNREANFFFLLQNTFLRARVQIP